MIFGGYLAGTTPVLSVRSSLFVLYRCCFKHVRTVWLTIDFFGIISWRRLWERFSTLSPIASRTKSCMVLTCSMATTNNVQGDEPRPTALERQVQTLMAAVERLTKQNQDLEEQLR